jgi:uncharacterized protein (TIGR00299 family) protein
LIFDPFSGISGDMILGGLLDLGLSEDWLVELVSAFDLGARVRVTTERRGPLEARAVQVDVPRSDVRRKLDDVMEIVLAAPITSAARETAAAAFHRLAEVEGALHGAPPDQVHFHEVGAVDAIVDIVGAAAGIVELGVAACYTRPVALGRGWVKTAHGDLPLPAPATLRLLEGVPVIESDREGELTTPTGAVLLSVLTAGRRAPGEFMPLASGFGAGSRNPPTHPNCLRMILATTGAGGDMSIIQADVDDMPPEYVPSVMESLHEAGATDVWIHPIQMKKGRAGLRIEALVSEAARETVVEELFRTSTTIGLRHWPVERQVLPRTTETVEWRGFTIRLKMSELPDGHIRWKAEYEDVIRAARESGVPPLEVQREIEIQAKQGLGR